MYRKLVLASASPRRKELLATLGVEFVCFSADVDERVIEGEDPDTYVVRLAIAKARAGLESQPDAVVIGSDTSVIAQGNILGKPRDYQHYCEMISSLSGQTHQVMTSIAVVSSTIQRSQCVVTDVTFRDITENEMLKYWQTGEPADKAGGYGIQGKGGVFATTINGSYSAVVGLPVAQTAELLAEFDVDIWF